MASRATEDIDARAHLARVRTRLADEVEGYCRQHARFYLKDLTGAIAQACPGAPDSPGRILRDLRQRGRLDYRVVSRAMSLYEVIWVASGQRRLF